MQQQNARTLTTGCADERDGRAWEGAARRLRGTKLISALIAAAICPASLLASDAVKLQGTVPDLPARPPATTAQGHPASAPATTTATLSTLLFDFGNNLVGNKLIQAAVAVTNTGTSPLTMNPSLAGDASFSIVAGLSCGAQLAPGKSCDMVLRYVPTKASYPKQQMTMLSFNFVNAAAGVPGSVAIVGTSALFKTGTVTRTSNPQVALYTLTLPFPGRFRVEFGMTTSYGQRTWAQGTDGNNQAVSIFVAGMLPNTVYHMAAQVTFDNGISVTDEDHSFKSEAPSALYSTNFPHELTATTTEGMTPQPGIEMANPLLGLMAIDLEGNVLWTYEAPDPTQDYIDGVKMLPNGDILLVVAPLSNAPLLPQWPDTGAVFEIREINLAGDTVKELSIPDLNAALVDAPSTCKECAGLVVDTFHHDVTPLPQPNGHWLVLTSTVMNLGPNTTPKLNSKANVNVLGDVIIDLDENLQPVWAWNEFNHLDVNRQPYSFPDWTHTNAVLYSPDDGNILVSIRHQNWIVKVDYKNGSGSGDILWKLGEGGDFKLVDGSDPVDWQYAQHDPGYFSPNTSGVFSLGVMDNGDDRLYPAGNKCTPQGKLPASCLYTTIPVFKIDEKAMTATLTFHQKIPANLYSNFGGNTDELANGDVEYDLCGLIVGKAPGSLVREVTQDSEMKTVWSLSSADGNFYRAFRIPSLYPGIQWTGISK